MLTDIATGMGITVPILIFFRWIFSLYYKKWAEVQRLKELNMNDNFENLTNEIEKINGTMNKIKDEVNDHGTRLAVLEKTKHK